MDLDELITELRCELEMLDGAILSLERWARNSRYPAGSRAHRQDTLAGISDNNVQPIPETPRVAT